MSHQGKMEQHSFWCISCGQRGIPLARPSAKKKEQFHKKKLYCIYCKAEINHIECKNQFEIEEFKKMFEEGKFLDESNLVFV